MKSKLLILIVIAFFATNSVYSQYVEDTITAYRTETAPVIDGDIDAVWDAVPFVPITWWGREEGTEEPKPAPDEYDFKADFKMMWDDTYVYFLGVIVDDVVADQANAVELGAENWESDSWEFYIAPTLSKLPNFNEMTQIRFSYANQGNADATSVTTQGWAPDPGFMNGIDYATAARKLSDDGWDLEVKLELAKFAAQVDEIDAYALGDIIGFNITVSDRDDEATRDDIGNFCIDTQWDEADTLSILKLGGEYVVNIDNNSAVSNIQIYPNPVTKKINISSNVVIDKIEIINALGSVVLRQSDIIQSIDVSKLNPGLYFVKAYSNGYSHEVHKFIKK